MLPLTDEQRTVGHLAIPAFVTLSRIAKHYHVMKSHAAWTSVSTPARWDMYDNLEDAWYWFICPLVWYAQAHDYDEQWVLDIIHTFGIPSLSLEENVHF